MDPTNNPTPNPNPVSPTPEVGGASTPVTSPVASEMPGPVDTASVSEPTIPTPEPVVPAASEPAAPSTPEPAAPVVSGPVNPGIGATNPISGMGEPTVSIPEPTNPVVMPTQGGTNNESPVGDLESVVNSFGAPANNFTVSATDPIMMPDTAPKPDPVEEELKAPMKAAAPVPGSIGSAISGPTGGAAATMPNPQENNTPSVAFNETGMGGSNATNPKENKMGIKSNKTTLIALIAIASVIVIVLVIILIVTLNSGGSNSGTSNGDSGNTAPNPPAAINPDNETSDESEESDESDESNGSTLSNTLVCSRSMTEAEIARYNDVISGTYNITAEFDTDKILTNITLVESVVYRDENVANNEPVEMDVHEAAAKDLTVSNGLTYFLDAVGADGNLDLSFDAIKTNYEVEDFTCD